MEIGSHSYIDNPKNENVKIFINGELFERSKAKVSVFDSGFLLGDGLWEGMRLHNGHIAFVESHLKRLYEGAKAIQDILNPDLIIRIGQKPVSKNLLWDLYPELYDEDDVDFGWKVQLSNFAKKQKA